MPVVKFRLLLLVLLLLGATVSVCLSFEDDADILAWQGQPQTLHLNPQEKAPSRLLPPSPSARLSRTNFNSAFRSRVSVIDLISVLRC